MKKVAEKWKIWDEEEVVARSEEEAKKLVPEKFLISGSKCLGRKQVRGCQQEKYRITPLI